MMNIEQIASGYLANMIVAYGLNMATTDHIVMRISPACEMLEAFGGEDEVNDEIYDVIFKHEHDFTDYAIILANSTFHKMGLHTFAVYSSFGVDINRIELFKH